MKELGLLECTNIGKGGVMMGLFTGRSEVLFFIILFLLLFYTPTFGVGRRYGVCSEADA